MPFCKGFIITAIDKEKVDTVDELAKRLGAVKGGVLLEGRYPDDDETRYFGLSSS